MLRKLIITIYCMPLYYIMIIMMLMVVLWVCLYLLGKRKNIFWKNINSLVVGASVFVILITTLFFRTEEGAEIILIPFHSFLEAQTQPEIYRSMFMNIFLFFPLGLTLPFALPEKWNRKALRTIIFAFILSFTIEFLQFHYRLGRAETDDVICNTLGAAIGTLSYTLERKFFDK